MVSLWHYDCLFIGLFILLLCNWACIRNTDKVAVHISVCAALGLFPACVPLPSVQSAYSVLCSVISFNGVMNKWKKTWMLSTRSWKTRDACSRKKGQTGRPTSACNSSRWRPPGTAHTGAQIVYICIIIVTPCGSALCKVCACITHCRVGE